jgi:hypothetical protein
MFLLEPVASDMRGREPSQAQRKAVCGAGSPPAANLSRTIPIEEEEEREKAMDSHGRRRRNAYGGGRLQEERG